MAQHAEKKSGVHSFLIETVIGKKDIKDLFAGWALFML